MNDMNNMNDHNLQHHDPEHNELIEQLDSLAGADRSIPDQGFEQRIMDSISKQIAPEPIHIQTQSTTQHTHAAFQSWKFNIAAAILVVGSLSVLLWSSTRTAKLVQPQTTTAQQTLVSLEEDIDALFDLSDFASEIDQSIDELDLITDQMHTELSLPSVLMEASNSDLEGSL